jgi:DHA1 family bicyclomycin/chloramphenicol resistance-like MFS transporter
MMTMKIGRFYTILILGALIALGPFSIDMYLPGFPEIAKDLRTTTADVALSLSSFFIGISAGQLLYGPLYDRFGRKTPLIIGLSVYIVASVMCAFSDDIEFLIIMRFIQAIGSCAAGVAATVSVRDLFPVNENAKIFSLLMLVLGTSPMIAPTLGGYVTKAFGWQSIFIFLAALAIVILLAVIFALPTVYKPNKSLSLKPAPILRGFAAVIRVPQFYTYASAGAVVFAGLFAYVSASPMIFMEIYNVKGEVYGWIFAFLSAGFIGASQINSYLLKMYSSERIVSIALLVQSFIAASFLFASYFDLLNLYTTILFIFLYLSTIGFIAPNASALTMAPFSENAGSASSLMGASQLFLGAVASVGISMIQKPSAVPLALIMAVASLLALLIILFGRKRIIVENQFVAGE